MARLGSATPSNLDVLDRIGDHEGLAEARRPSGVPGDFFQ